MYDTLIDVTLRVGTNSLFVDWNSNNNLTSDITIYFALKTYGLYIDTTTYSYNTGNSNPYIQGNFGGYDKLEVIDYWMTPTQDSQSYYRLTSVVVE